MGSMTKDGLSSVKEETFHSIPNGLNSRTYNQNTFQASQSFSQSNSDINISRMMEKYKKNNFL